MNAFDQLFSALADAKSPPRRQAAPRNGWSDASPVEYSPDFARIKSLPRRVQSTGAAEAVEMTALLRRPVTSCDCVARWGYCIDTLNPTQGFALSEVKNTGRLAGLIGVGYGKTGISILLPVVLGDAKNVVLLIPPRLRDQFVNRDYPQWSVHFRTPNLIGGASHTEDVPSLTVVTYSELSSPKNSDLLARLKPDAVVADEAHKLKNPSAARTKRFLSALRKSAVRFFFMSGTVTTRSPADCGHLFASGFGDASPMPLAWPVLQEWASAVIDSLAQRPAGVLEEFCAPGESPADGLARRIRETPGVVSTTEQSVDCELDVAQLPVALPAEIEPLLAQVKSGVRPDGEHAESALEQWRWSTQLAAGFYTKWIYPHGESREQIDAWFEARKAYRAEVYQLLKRSRMFLDSPRLAMEAAIRAEKNYVGPKPVWHSAHWAAWKTIRKTVRPEPKTVWVSEFLLDAAERWARESPGIVWTQHQEFGARLAARLKVPWYHGGDLSPTAERGDRSAVLSLNSALEGLNLQHAFARNLYASVPSDGTRWEQSLGRTHRQGQRADCVTADVFLHTEDLRKAFESARADARYQSAMTGPKKLQFARVSLVD